MRTLTLLKRLLFVPKCASCEKRLSPFPNREFVTHGRVCFCKKCHTNWLNATSKFCVRCALPAYKCTCVPRYLRRYFDTVPSICFYNSEKEDIINKVIFSIKRKRNSELINYIAFELYPHIAKAVDSNLIPRSSLIFTWIPRRRSSISKYGFDQGEELCRSVANLFGARALPLFLKVGGEEQKELDSKERWENIKNSVSLNYNLIGCSKGEKYDDLQSLLENKTVILIDDIITTGASIRHGIDLLKSISDQQIFVASIAKAGTSYN